MTLSRMHEDVVLMRALTPDDPVSTSEIERAKAIVHAATRDPEELAEVIVYLALTLNEFSPLLTITEGGGRLPDGRPLTYADAEEITRLTTAALRVPYRKVTAAQVATLLGVSP